MLSASDHCSWRGIHMGITLFSSIILNKGELTQPPLEQPVDVALTLAMAELKAHFIDSEKGVVRYSAIRGSQEFERYQFLTRTLRPFDLRSLDTREKRLAFWINIYNTLVIHGVIELGIQHSVKECGQFFDRVVYEIGGHRFSLNEIEHGILRGNRRQPYHLWKPFGRQDARLEFSLQPMDPRIHFTLVCGARSCPPIGFYEAAQIDSQLQLAAQTFINSSQVRFFTEEGLVSVSMIFKWYKADFGGTRDGLVGTLLQFLDEGENKAFLTHHRHRVRIKYHAYDWRLNQ